MAEFTKLLPVPNQTGVPRTAAVNFTVLDGYTGTQINTLSTTIAGSAVISNGVFVNDYSGQILPSINKWIVSIYPKTPLYLPHASKIDIVTSVLDSYNNLDSYGWSFYTIGYITPGAPDPIPPGGPIPPTAPERACLRGKPFFIDYNVGLKAALDEGTGSEVELKWNLASPYDENNVTVYNIYSSTKRINVFDSFPDFMSTDLSTTIGGLAPGDTYFFGLRASEFNPNISSFSGLNMAGPDLYYYPSTELSEPVLDSYSTINVNSINSFPESGIILINDELIRYSSLQHVPPAFITEADFRGFYETVSDTHAINSTVLLYRGVEDGNTVIAQTTPSFQKPNWAITHVQGDGYGPDGYRDGYDGYAFHDGYFIPREIERDDITSPVDSNDNAGDFPSFDYCGTWRRQSPQNFWQGQCTGSYFGGIQKKNGVFVRETNVFDHMLQREELLLETTGEPFVLLRRKWTGVRCVCHRLHREHPDKRCPICFGTGFQGGYDQFINNRRPDGRILARVSPANDDLKIEDKGGLTPDYAPNVWTIAFPGLKDRDILIRFNEDGTEEFRYMILNVERLRAFFGRPGAQKFNMQRYHRTDIIYQFPAQRNMSPRPSSIETSFASGSGISNHKHLMYIPDGANILNINGVTAVVEGHSHIVKNGKIQPALGHSHTF